MPISGPAVAKFNNGTVIGLNGGWNVSVGTNVFRSYGQGEQDPVTGQLIPGSGYNGSSVGSGQSVSGSFEFVVDQDGANVKRLIEIGARDFFTIDWPNGDPLQGVLNFKAIDAHFDRLAWDNDPVNGRLVIRGEMTAGRVTGPGWTS